MKIICAWCEVEGKPGLIGERAPMLDERPTHGICRSHLIGYLALCGVTSEDALDTPAEPPMTAECGMAPAILSATV